MVSGKRGWAMFLIWTMGVLSVLSVAATVHKVGDSAGWTLLVPVDYAKWPSFKHFHVGDSLLFSYNNKFHNVLQVNQQQFESCNASSPAASYNSGADSIPLKRPGTFYFLCGFPGHCQAGQKVEIKVTRASSSAGPLSIGPGPAPLGSPFASPAAAPAAAPVPSSAAASILHLHLHHCHFSLLLLPLPAYVVAFYYLCV